MTKIELIHECEKIELSIGEQKVKLYDLLIRSGLVSTTTNSYREIYQHFKHRIERGQKKMDAYTELSDNCGQSIQTIITACNTMKSDV